MGKALTHFCITFHIRNLSMFVIIKSVCSLPSLMFVGKACAQSCKTFYIRNL